MVTSAPAMVDLPPHLFGTLNLLDSAFSLSTNTSEQTSSYETTHWTDGIPIRGKLAVNGPGRTEHAGFSAQYPFAERAGLDRESHDEPADVHAVAVPECLGRANSEQAVVCAPKGTHQSERQTAVFIATKERKVIKIQRSSAGPAKQSRWEFPWLDSEADQWIVVRAPASYAVQNDFRRGAHGNGMNFPKIKTRQKVV